jgi:hypothetical protein
LQGCSVHGPSGLETSGDRLRVIGRPKPIISVGGTSAGDRRAPDVIGQSRRHADALSPCAHMRYGAAGHCTRQWTSWAMGRGSVLVARTRRACPPRAVPSSHASYNTPAKSDSRRKGEQRGRNRDTLGPQRPSHLQIDIPSSTDCRT